MLGLRYVDQRGDAGGKLPLAALWQRSARCCRLRPRPRSRTRWRPPRPRPRFRRTPRLSTTLRSDPRPGAARHSRTRMNMPNAPNASSRRPVQLGFMDRARVLGAWCELREDFRTFRTDRIIAMTRLDRYPGRRADLVRRLRAHLDGLAGRDSPDGNCQGGGPKFFATSRAKEIAMQTDITHNLPKIVADHIAACNSHDVEAWMATFAPDALLNDVTTGIYRGGGDPRLLPTRRCSATNVTMACSARLGWTRRHNGPRSGSTALTTRQGLPDPLILSLYFSLRVAGITQLIFIHNKTKV